MSAITDLFILLVLGRTLYKLVQEARGWEADDDVGFVGNEAAGSDQGTSPADPVRSPAARGPSSLARPFPEEAFLAELADFASHAAGTRLAVLWWRDFDEARLVFAFSDALRVTWHFRILDCPSRRGPEIIPERLIKAIETESPWAKKPGSELEPHPRTLDMEPS